MKQKTLRFYKGLPGSGKSTDSREIMTKEPGKWKRINKDDMRLLFDNSNHSKSNEKFVNNMEEMLIKEAFRNHYNVIWDNTHLHEIHLKRAEKIVDEMKLEGISVNLEIIDFTDVSLETCIERNNQRTVGKIPTHVIKNMYNQHIRKRVPDLLAQDPNLPKAIIVDMDGTLAFMGDRSPYDGSKCELDTLNSTVKKTIDLYVNDGYKVIICSGRDEGDAREPTERWLIKYKIPYTALFMRAAKDNRQDSIVKREIFYNNIFGVWNIHLVLDDRTQVVEEWRKIGLVCYQVAFGDF